MIGQQIESHPRFPLGAVLFLVFTAVLVAVGLSQDAADRVPTLVVGVLPLFISLALFRKRQPHFVAEFTSTAIHVSQPAEQTIPYDSLQGLWGKGRSSDPTRPGPPSFLIRLVHDEGELSIPARLNVPSDDVYLFLYEQFPPEGARGVSPPLRKYLAEQEGTFGLERVFSYRARSHLGFGATYPRARGISLAVMLTGIAWIILGASLRFKAFEGFIGFGIMFVLLGLIFFLAFLADARRAGGHVKQWRQASLVISPVGMALVQGDVKGEMHWDELRDVQLRSRYASFSMSSSSGMPGIVLKFEGASITIADIYDQPLRIIFERIRSYWK